jgi:hypothetical protein
VFYRTLCETETANIIPGTDNERKDYSRKELSGRKIKEG